MPGEESLRRLSGYPGGADKVGNWVNRQFQPDALGEALQLFAAAAGHDHLDTVHWQAAEVAVKAIETRWCDPDAGVWELDNHHWAHSRLMCVAGLRAIAGAGAAPGPAAAWETLADTILADVAADSVHASGRWQRAPDDDRVDAALLLAAIRGAVPATDPRSLATLDAIAAGLSSDGYVYRYRHDQRPLQEAEGAFVLCGFLMALATHQLGRTAEATGWFERHRAACGPPALFTEEFDTQPASAARQPAAGVRACGDVRVVGAAGPALGRGLIPRTPGNHRPGPLRIPPENVVQPCWAPPVSLTRSRSPVLAGHAAGQRILHPAPPGSRCLTAARGR